MTQYWEPGTQYNHGDIVQYNGHRYKIIQPHSSQSDWLPTTLPLCGDASQMKIILANATTLVINRAITRDSSSSNTSLHPHLRSNLTTMNAPDKKPDHKAWFDFDGEKKHQLEVGGGLVAGAALLGAGYLAFKGHKKSEEEKKAQTWALQNWLQDAQARTEQYRHNGPRGPAEWILNQGKNIPHNAIVVGREHDWTLYICRAFYEGGIQIGKASDVFKKGAVIGYDDEEIHLDTYEILVGDMRGLRWVDASGRLDVAALGARPVEGGRESDGTPLYIAEAPHKGAVHPGKASSKLDGAVIPYDNHEKTVHNYRVLCYA
ncbi:carbohydrate-binding module family 12 protein [Desarmillaria tabescens]|uniref:Carbohydrate-binding module family 12 protein n=1 Tax=Armillaria tabescens TaxID=1929756 RepID=A0AA39JCA3_ARMTA|nr:carbohydrate-binding module family 12 protein [Desarmillaria tabescens]KAK0438699.1 carbohydrate-binding module family 12 protein [Desarmillaria tabescens]